YHHDVAGLIDAEIADQLFEFGDGRHHERDVVARHAPARLVVVAVDAARDVRGRISLRAAAIDGRTATQADPLLIGAMRVEPRRSNKRLGRGTRYRRGQGGAEQDRGADTTQRFARAEANKCFHDTGSWVEKPPMAAIDCP